MCSCGGFRFIALGVSPLKFIKTCVRDSVSYDKRKIQNVHKVLTGKIIFTGLLAPNALDLQPSTSNECLNGIDFKNFI